MTRTPDGYPGRRGDKAGPPGQLLVNPAATAFWRKAIPVPFHEHKQDAEIVQSFTTGH